MAKTTLILNPLMELRHRWQEHHQPCLSPAAMLKYLGKDESALLLKGATPQTANQENLTVDHGGSASTTDFFNALRANLPWLIRKFSNGYIAHFEFLNLAGNRHREPINNRTMLGTLK